MSCVKPHLEQRFDSKKLNFNNSKILARDPFLVRVSRVQLASQLAASPTRRSFELDSFARSKRHSKHKRR